jgi:hypothetical protein
LSKVSTGMMDRDAAVQTLITVYGIDREVAEKITPEEARGPDEECVQGA